MFIGLGVSLPEGSVLWSISGLISHTGRIQLFWAPYSVCCIEPASDVCLSIKTLNTRAAELYFFWNILHCSLVILGEVFDLLSTLPGSEFSLLEIMRVNCVLQLIWCQDKALSPDCLIYNDYLVVKICLLACLLSCPAALLGVETWELLRISGC